LCSLESTKL